MTQTAPTTLKVLSTLAIAAPLPELADRFRQSTGIALDVEQAPTTVLTERVASGVRADVIVLGKDELDRLVREGTLDASSAADLVRSFVGIAVRAGAPKPAIGTVEEFIATLRNARSIAYSQGGASGLFFAALLKRLGMDEEVNAKATITPGGFTGELVARGEVELAVQQVSELMNVRGVEVVGRLPEEIGSAPVFSVGMFAASTRRADAERLIGFLCSAEAAATFKRYGLEPLNRR